MILNQLTSSAGLIAKVAAKNKVCSPRARPAAPRAARGAQADAAGGAHGRCWRGTGR